MSELNPFNRDLMAFLAASPTPFHAVAQMAERLEQHGFSRLYEGDGWTLQPGGRYYLTRNDSSLVAFIHGRRPVLETGWRMIGAHTDSPCLKLKPAPARVRNGYLQLGVEVYGGALLNPWFDRDLGLAGRISYLTSDDTVASALLNIQRPVAVIPSLAIHLDREANNSRSINAQTDLPPLLMRVAENEKPDFSAMLSQELKAQHPDRDIVKLLDWELSFHDLQPPALVGWQEEFLASARLDNLLSCYVGMRALTDSDDEVSAVLVCNDHEEVGSQSASGAQGPLLRSLLARLVADPVQRTRAIDRSMLISADNAHGIHPNYADRHDGEHAPLLNGGPVIKVNANQRYATNSETAAVFRHLAGRVQVPVQSFAMRSDLACGSTIGPISAAEIGVRTLDVGVPTFAMHSVRELGGVRDSYYLKQVLQEFVGQATLSLV